MTERLGDWMLTYTGRQFWPLDPRPEDVCIGDIATARAHQGRYNGHSRHFYSVAQHSALMARWFMARGDLPMARWALLHDAAEAYLGDVIRPIKPFLPGFAAIEAKVETVVWPVFGLGAELPSAVKDADRKIVVDEMIALFPREALRHHGIDQRAPLGVEVRALLPWKAHDVFLQVFGELWSR